MNLAYWALNSVASEPLRYPPLRHSEPKEYSEWSARHHVTRLDTYTLVPTRNPLLHFQAMPDPSTPKKLRARARALSTPKKRKSKTIQPIQGSKLAVGIESQAQVKTRLRKRLHLDFDPDDWQVAAVQKIRQGCDSIIIAGTGAGKSLVFQGLAALSPKMAVIIISPLKALERDQVRNIVDMTKALY